MKSGSTRRALDPVYVPGSNPGGSSIIERDEELIIYVILIIAFCVAYCEFMCWLVKEKKRPVEIIKQTFKFMIGLNFILSIMFHALASVIFASIILLYYLVIIDYRCKKN